MKRSRNSQPFFGKTILRYIIPDYEQEALLGDFDEIYQDLLNRKGRLSAFFWYWRQIVILIPSFLRNSIYWSVQMIKNYLKITFRNIRRHKGYSFINIAGLAIGITACVLLLLWVQDEWNYDRFHTNANELYRVLLDPQEASTTHEAVSPPVLAAKMKENFPEVVNTARISTSGTLLLKYGDKAFYEGEGIFADATFFEMFSFPFVQGNPDTAFSELHSIVITEDLARKYFGSENPLGKILTINNKTDYKVSGIIKNVPHNSHLNFNYVRSFELLKEFGVNINSWGNVSFYTYVQLQKNSTSRIVDEKLKSMIEKENPGHNLYYLQPLTQIHLRSNFNFDPAVTGNIMYIYIFTAAALFILFIACINFMNLATARSGTRSKEVGMRKAVGAYRIDIIKQFFGESILLSFTSLLFSVIMLQIFLPVFNDLAGKELSLSYSGFLQILLGLMGITLFTGLLSGSYPAMFLSSFQTVNVIKNLPQSGTKGSLFRKILVVTQFSLTIIILIGTIVVHDQLNHIRNQNLGYDKDYMVCFPLRGEIVKKLDATRAELLKNPNILNFAVSSSLPTHIGSGTSGADWEGKPSDVRIQMQFVSVDHSYLDTYRMEMAEGRFFAKDFESDSKEGFILNEAAIKAMGMDSPVGKRFGFGRSSGRIIGVIKNFNYKSLHSEIEPLILINDPRGYRYASIRISSENIEGTITHLENVWNQFSAGFPFNYTFLDDRIENLYRSEQSIGTVFNYFTILVVFIACLGLFGLASFTAEKRTKEIGIRKVLGAPISNILMLLFREFTKWIILANIIAWPAAYFIMTKWLENFAYRTNIGIATFFLAAGFVLVIALITVSYQCIKTALSNPVDSLKYE
jgi:ABC-type antimicrobial peptide transport system permease subunit